MFAQLTRIDILYAAIAAFVLTLTILHLERVWNTLRREYDAKMGMGISLETVIARCRMMFPIPEVDFRGKNFHAGTTVRITTLQQNVIEGKLIGKNSKDILCILTKHQIIAHELDKISEMVMVEEKIDPKE